MRTFTRTLFAAAILLGVSARPAAASSPCAFGTLPGGAQSMICVPPPGAWNGALVVFGHGYVPDGAGPTFFECRTFRWSGHVGPSWDMDVGVRRRDELQGWLARDPIARLRKTMDASGADAATFEAIERSVTGQIREAQQFARMSPYPHARDLTTHVYYAQPREC